MCVCWCGGIVSIHSRLKAAGGSNGQGVRLKLVSIHSRLKAAGWLTRILCRFWLVSIHSRLKAAGPEIPA